MERGIDGVAVVFGADWADGARADALILEGLARSNSEAEKLESVSDGESRCEVGEKLRSWPRT